MISWLLQQALTPAGKATGAILLIVAITYALYGFGFQRGREAVLAHIASDRVRILVDGKAIDNAVLASDDSALCDRLGGCL